MINSEGAVYDIPTGVLICCVEEKQVNVNAISNEYIEIKMSSELELSKLSSLKLWYLDFKNNKYNSFLISDYECVSHIKEKYCYTYEFKILEPNYDNVVSFVIKQYQDYIMAKIYDEPIGSYPKEKDDIIASSYDEWINNLEINKVIKHLADLTLDAVNNRKVQLGITIDNYMLYKAYIDGTLYNKIVEASTQIYFGNQFCHNQFPDNDTLIKLMNRAKTEGKNISVCFTYLRQELIKQTKQSINLIYDWSTQNKYPIEIVINDYGMLELLNSSDYLGDESRISLSLGVLLNKRRKDPRLIYKYGSAISPQNQTNQKIYSSFLYERGIRRIEQEACNYKLDLNPNFSHSLHLPLYQTNTSQYCTLYALCEQHDRSKQKFVTECPRYCERYVCLYPDHLNMMGKYNSLFAISDDHTKIDFEKYDRIVWNMI